MHFSSFGPLRYKRILISCLVYKTGKIYSPETLDKEVECIREVLKTIGCPDGFLRRLPVLNAIRDGERRAYYCPV